MPTLRIVALALLAVAASPSGGCDRASHSPCAGKRCGDPCNSCGTPPCETATACDRSGECVTATPWLCYDPCAGKACGDACQVCPPDATDCMSAMCVTTCDGAGRCTCSGGGQACR